MNHPDQRKIECLVCGLATVDIVARPVPLDKPIGKACLIPCQTINATTGGLVSNAGIALARLGIRTAALAYIGNDPWADLVQRQYQAAGLDTTHLVVHPTAGTPVTIVLVDETGERSFLFELGAARDFGAEVVLARTSLLADSHWLLYGYYSLVPERDQELPRIFATARKFGCLTALDAAGSGGALDPLREILPYCDIYFPSLVEARQQTQCDDPVEILEAFRDAGATGIVGLKLGPAGALVSARRGEIERIEPIAPPGPLVDTTGAGDAFFAGLLAGLLRGLSLRDAGRLAAAAGACCVTGLGASAGLRDFEQTSEIAGLG